MHETIADAILSARAEENKTKVESIPSMGNVTIPIEFYTELIRNSTVLEQILTLFDNAVVLNDTEFPLVSAADRLIAGFADICPSRYEAIVKGGQ